VVAMLANLLLLYPTQPPSPPSLPSPPPSSPVRSRLRIPRAPLRALAVRQSVVRQPAMIPPVTPLFQDGRPQAAMQTCLIIGS
jgi:hypothetical protein